MDEKERFGDPGPAPGDDEVEILEVVGVENGPAEADVAEAHGRNGENGEDGEVRHDEYFLDFDEPPPDLNADRGSGPSGYTPSHLDLGVDGESDRQRLMRLRADYDNLRKRIDRERLEFEVYANFALVGKLLPVIDNLERALAVSAGPEGPLREGLAMIRRQLRDQLEDDGLTVIETVGQIFDPTIHDAVATEPSEDEPANTILEELQKGYLFRERVLRPALVKVSTGRDGASGSTLPESNVPEHEE